MNVQDVILLSGPVIRLGSKLRTGKLLSSAPPTRETCDEI